MKNLSSSLLIALTGVLFALSACSAPSGPEPLSIQEEPGKSVPSATPSLPATQAATFTATMIPITETLSYTPTNLPVTEMSSPTLTSIPQTETQAFVVAFPSQTPPSFTNSIVVYLPNLSGSFNVGAGNAVTITNKGTNGTYTCRIYQGGRQIGKAIVLKNQSASKSSTLARGEYRLNCGRQNYNATIFSE